MESIYSLVNVFVFKTRSYVIMCNYFSQHTLHYRFPTYKQLIVPCPMYYAMENITLVTWEAWWLMDRELARDMGRECATLNLHEMAHAYFGMSQRRVHIFDFCCVESMFIKVIAVM